ncbi:hypothetical protein FMM05_15940 [Flavobacterium zepuense]|uniref:Bacteriophage abortive infection AbiH n=1 Tax=Flavobacterium zepuense TaxID=2593302 RepID=A0A552UX12_9FLAO|nr:AbiH family protein [Flavobacterium zepuense]TRW22747.1 hypothetical protein FMM05_15940 [Flavobacterium zepuense]
MNRLVIIGNGFDLAHGLPTSYGHFIDWYWEKVFKKLHSQNTNDSIYYEDNLLRFDLNLFGIYSLSIVNSFKAINSYTAFEKFLVTIQENNYYNDENHSFTYYNSFFQIINNRKSVQNWVDIENEYYKLLRDCLKENNSNHQVKKLHEEFEQVKSLLEKYLHENVANLYDFERHTEYQNTIDIFNLNYRKQRKKYLAEFGDKDYAFVNDWIDEYKKIERTGLKTSDNYKVRNLFLNFNYTPTVDNYALIMNDPDSNIYGENEVIQIHGKLNDKDNPINFGFGDEMDDDYKTIEKKDDNEYLRNIKSFLYLQNSNYKKMLSFIETEEFQVYIMGHSCGLSDRILLNKIFEHNNCLSIKVFYHQFTKPKADGRTDNYTDIVQNISRHFNKKEMMREKIVNKSLCEPLSQNVRFESK